MRILWIRHGQMEIRAGDARDVSGINRLFSQELQGGLSDRGRREAQRVAEELSRRRVDALIASPLVRARETGAVSAAALGLDLAIDEDLVELRTGTLRSGSAPARFIDALTRAPAPYRVKRALVGGFAIPIYFESWRRGRTEGGESPRDLEGRLARVHAGLRRAHPEGASVAIFAHGFLIHALAARHARGRRARAALWARPYIPNGAITELAMGADGELALVRFADASHLRGIG